MNERKRYLFFLLLKSVCESERISLKIFEIKKNLVKICKNVLLLLTQI